MILVCPACETRYRVAAAALERPAGRRLRCANCGHSWRYRPEPPPVVEPALDVPAGAHPATAQMARAADPALFEAMAAEGAGLPSASETIAMEALGLDAAPDGARPPAVPRFAMPPSALRVDAALPVPGLAAPSAEARLDAPPAVAGPVAMPRPSVATELPTAAAAAHPRLPIVAGIGLAAVAAAVLWVALLARDRGMALWPAAAIRGYAAAPLAPPSGVGLKVTLTPQRAGDLLVINGDIVNSAAVARRIPRLRVTLRDGRETALASQVIDPPVAELPPGASTHFDAVFEHPNIAATGVAVSFATD